MAGNGLLVEIGILMPHLIRPQTEMGDKTRKKEGDLFDSINELGQILL